MQQSTKPVHVHSVFLNEHIDHTKSSTILLKNTCLHTKHFFKKWFAYSAMLNYVLTVAMVLKYQTISTQSANYI